MLFIKSQVLYHCSRGASALYHETREQQHMHAAIEKSEVKAQESWTRLDRWRKTEHEMRSKSPSVPQGVSVNVCVRGASNP